MNEQLRLAEKLCENGSLELWEYEKLITNPTEECKDYITSKAIRIRKDVYGDSVFIRGLIEISNICKNNCYYCGIRGGNVNCERYRITPKEILDCCRSGYAAGFRTFVLQGGEDVYFTDEILCELIKSIKSLYPDCALTLSLGERSAESYKRLRNAGADRYLLRHEAADEDLYSRLHPQNMRLESRMECLKVLKNLGFQTGCGFMVGAPYQTPAHIAKDLKFIEEFKPQMCGIGPFIPHKDTIFKSEKAGDADFTCYLLSIIRIICPSVLLPSTTALDTVDPKGCEKGILAGANVVMPNLSPQGVRGKYNLYNNKKSNGVQGAEDLKILKERMSKIGYNVLCDRGDVIELFDRK